MAIETCHWHPDRETGLRCGNCGKAVCTDCVRPHPVGVRCKECARPFVAQQHQASVQYYVRGIAAAVGIGLVGLFTLVLLIQIVPGVGFLFFLATGGLGYVIGEGVGVAVNQRRGRPYQYMALAGALIATAPVGIPALFSLSFNALFMLLGVFVAAIVAWNRRAI